MRRTAILGVALLLAGCGADPSVEDKWGGSVRLQIVPPAPAAGTNPAHVLVNESAETVTYGYPFVLERRTPAGWRHVDSPCAFILPALHLEPGEQSDPGPLVCPAEAPGLEAGAYRLVKDVDVYYTDYDRDAETLVATFFVF